MIVGFENYKHNYLFDVKGIIHVGAHTGQEYEEYVRNFGKVPIFWFEPIPSIFDILQKNLQNESNNFLFNLALGREPGNSEIYIDNGNDGQSSSILKPKKHIEQFPHITFSNSNKIPIKVEKLDNINTKSANMLVLDTQGYELNVLEGSILTLPNIDYIFTEFNTIEMYESCPKLEDLDLFLSEFGFIRVETWYTSDNWGDAFYIIKK